MDYIRKLAFYSVQVFFDSVNFYLCHLLSPFDSYFMSLLQKYLSSPNASIGDMVFKPDSRSKALRE
ncbi:MAG: hypothetical protein A2067_02385 [Deltaproteobacteria bacterium GWB2_42_7]|nr:MAG: hypothetical protein A2067_02385 [Deltaproteobacteria bacterium GWB2_42_7]